MHVARTIAKRSLCSRDQVGAVIVSASNRIIDTGYNGPPAGFTPITQFDDPHFAGIPGGPCNQWCPRAQKDNGYRAPEVVAEILDPHYDDCPALHAEANALMFSDRRLREGGTIYVTSGTCGACAKLVANSGLKRAVYDGLKPRIHRESSEWYDFVRACGLEVVIL